MSDNPTRETPDSRSFEERVFARFDAFDARFDSLDARMDRMEARMDRFESRIEAKVDALDSRLSLVEDRLSSVEGRLSSVENKVDGLDGRATALEEKVEARLRETRPIWEAVLARLTGIESELSTLNRQFNSLVLDFFRLRVRVEKLEEDQSAA